MKSLSLHKKRPVKAGIWLIFPVLMLALPGLRHQFYYPTSDVFVNPSTGQPDPEFAKYVMPFVTKTDDEISIDMGDVPADVIKGAAFQYLSPVIRMNPKISLFRVTWSIHVFNDFADINLSYNRKRGEVSVMQTETIPGNLVNISLLGKYLTDRDIHQAAQSDVDYDVWAEKHWEK